MSIVSIIIAYLIGSISTSTIVSKWFAKIDIRDHGSGNAGATNTLRILGLKWAIVVLAIDIVKGMLAVFVAWTLGHGSPYLTYLAGLCVIAGHNWPIFFGFRGGKGIATTIGVLATVMFLPAFLAGILAIALVVMTRYVSLGALIFTVLTPVFAIILQHPWGQVIFASVIAILSLVRHRKNILRLIKGKENRVFSKM